jgi:hypothetical protein
MHGQKEATTDGSNGVGLTIGAFTNTNMWFACKSHGSLAKMHGSQAILQRRARLLGVSCRDVGGGSSLIVVVGTGDGMLATPPTPT